MSARTETIAHLTCDNCGKQQTGPGIVGWWQLDAHPDGLDTFPFNQHRPPFDLCSWKCLATYALKFAREVFFPRKATPNPQVIETAKQWVKDSNQDRSSE